MTNPNQPIQVDPAHIANHTTRIREMLGDLTRVLEAASYIADCQDGFGRIPSPMVEALMADYQDDTLRALRALAVEAAAVPGKLAQTTSEFQDRDGAIGRNLQGLQNQINNIEGA